MSGSLVAEMGLDELAMSRPSLRAEVVVAGEDLQGDGRWLVRRGRRRGRGSEWWKGAEIAGKGR